MDDVARAFADIAAPLEAETKILLMERLEETGVENPGLAFGGALFALGRVLGGFIAAGVSLGVLTSTDTAWEAVRSAAKSAADEVDEVWRGRFDA